MLTGGAVLIVAVAALVRLALPSGFVAVTTTRMALPTSSAPSVYVAAVAFGMSVPSRCHW